MLKIYNSLSKNIDSFIPASANQVKVYCCGPTVYGYQHIGNLRTYLFEDVLVKTLRLLGYAVEHVMNITDVGHLVSDADAGEDKMLLAARREKKKSHEIADYYTAQFFQDSAKLNIRRPDVVCKATEHIQEMIELIQRIEANGYAYVANGNVYFDVAKFKEYGKMANLDLEKLQAGARIEVDEFKRSPFDFVLWFTNSKFENQELQWDSPWGRGYPGWHIECSAMSMKYLGDQFDIHCGGIDHIPVHHTNEIAQSEAATQKPWVNYWMHGQFLTVDGEKMSKSKGNLYLIKDIEERKLDPLAFRYLCLNSHYRAHMNFTWETLENADSGFKRLKRSVVSLLEEVGGAAGAENITANAKQAPPAFREEFLAALADDLNTAKAMTVLWKFLGDKELGAAEKLNCAIFADQVLGFGVDGWAQEATADLPNEITQLVAAREAARKAKNWTESDRLRDEIKSRGYTIEDSAKGMVVRRG